MERASDERLASLTGRGMLAGDVALERGRAGLLRVKMLHVRD
jgi:hypothetical protein